MEKDFNKILRAFEEQYENPLQEFCQGIAKVQNKKEWEVLDKFFDEEFKKEKKDLGADFQALANGFCHISFGVGFIYGQMFQPTGKEAKVAVNELRQRLINEDLLKYEPLEENQRA